jgi:uncharacterized protein YigE (DUF2233 family)
MKDFKFYVYESKTLQGKMALSDGHINFKLKNGVFYVAKKDLESATKAFAKSFKNSLSTPKLQAESVPSEGTDGVELKKYAKKSGGIVKE